MSDLAPPAWMEWLRLVAVLAVGAGALWAGAAAVRRSQRCVRGAGAAGVSMAVVGLVLTPTPMQDRFGVFLAPLGSERVLLCVAGLVLLGIGLQMELPSIRRPYLTTLVALDFLVILSYTFGPVYWCYLGQQTRVNFPDADGNVQQSAGSTCAPASGAMLLARYGIRISEGALAQMSCTSPVLGTFEHGLASAVVSVAHRHGRQAHMGRIGYDRALTMRRPFVAFINSPIVGGHTVLAERLDAKDASLVDPITGHRLRMSRKEFEAQWDGGAVWIDGPPSFSSSSSS